MVDNGQISIVIITYNRPADMLDLAMNISQLQSPELLKEVVIVNNRSTESYAEVEIFIKEHQEIPFRYFVAEKNLGVSAGRNFAVQQATAPFLVFVDDDALFQNKDALQQTIAAFHQNRADNSAVIAFKVFYHSTGQLQKTAFPHKDFQRKKHEHRFLTYYFAGCAHAVRREVFDKVGGYPENFFYGMEEYDLSYRILNAGFSIAYDDCIVVLHKESPEGRLTNKEKLRGMWVNKSIVAWKYLPEKYFYSTAFLWSLQYLKKTNFDIPGWQQGWRQVLSIKSRYKKNPLSEKALGYLKKVRARLWY